MSPSHMKITIEMPNEMLAQARRFAKREGLTLNAVLELGLRKVIAEKGALPTFKLRDASFKGKGLSSKFRNASWEEIREAAYSRRGG